MDTTPYIGLVTELWDVDCRLAEMSLTREGLLRVRDMAVGAAADATPYHPANAAGLMSYIEGVRGLRFEFIGDDWQLDRLEGMEFIKNSSIKVRVGFCNTVSSSGRYEIPKARSPKGPGAERACQHNLAFDFGEMDVPVDNPHDDYATYFLMVESCGKAELSRPVIKNGNFVDYIERLALSDGSDVNIDPDPSSEYDGSEEFDPVVARR